MTWRRPSTSQSVLLRARFQFSSSFQFFASPSTTARGLGKTKQYLSLTFERGHPDHTSSSAVAFLASAAVPSEYGELWAAHGAALPGRMPAASVSNPFCFLVCVVNSHAPLALSAAFGMSRAEDLLKIDLFNCEPSRSPMNSISVQEVDIAYKNNSCDFRRLYSFGIQDDDSKAVPASSPNLCHSLDSSIGDAAISVSLLKDTYVQFIAPSRDMIISKCKVFRHTTWSDPSLSFPHSFPLLCPGPTTGSKYGI